VLWVDRALKAADVLHWLQRAIQKHGAPEYLRSDNGSAFIAKIVQQWLKENYIKTIYIEPGSPWQNGFVESVHGRFPDECLNQEQLWTLTEARGGVGDYRRNTTRLGRTGGWATRARRRLRRATGHLLQSGYALPPQGMDNQRTKI
jgi:putative transposase